MLPIPPAERRTGLLVPVAAEGLVGDFRRRFNATAVARRLPPHITVLFPFALAEDVDDGLCSDLVAHFAALGTFEAELTAVRRSDEYLWLAPTPRDLFLDLITRTRDRFPAISPYDGKLGQPEPHLTIAKIEGGATADLVAEVARSELGPSLPYRFTVTAVSLFEEGGDGTFQESARFELG